MNPVELIKKKREGAALSENEFKHLIDGYLSGEVTDYQISAFFMACFFQGMTPQETKTFTSLMINSGVVVDLSHIQGKKVDKHSTGGVGDKVSLILAPMVAACGVPVPMISGRGLGHTGGTLDKLESIPGFRTDLDLNEYKNVIQELNLVMIGQTAEIAPADKKMYALRDVTATVQCIPLIAGSILSKKIAEGIDALVLDVKTGRGAFMRSIEQATTLAHTLVHLAEEFGKETFAFLTNMDQPLGSTIGNWLEVVESVICLRSAGDIPYGSSDLMELTYAQGAAMVLLGGQANSLQEGRALCEQAIRSGTAYSKFIELIERQGGEISFIEDLDTYPRSRFSADIHATEDGFLTDINPLELGYAAISLGAGRIKVGEAIDPKAGIVLQKKTGEVVRAGDVILTIYTDREDQLLSVKERIRQAIKVGPSKVALEPLIYSLISKNGTRTWL